jgi:hypothetical protein
MKKLLGGIGLALAISACSNTEALEIPKGSDVTVQKRDGVQVAGRLVEVQSRDVVLEARDGQRIQVRRADIESVKAVPRAEAPAAPAAQPAEAKDAAAPANPLKKMFDREPEYREVTVPAGTVLPVELATAVGSDTSHVEDPVRGTLRHGVTIDGVEAIPAGTTLNGHVTAADRPGKVKGRGAIGFRFSQLDLPGEGDRVSISTATVSRLAPATKKQDAAKIGGGAAGGAIIGGIIGGGDGAAKGAAIGGGAGTAVVLSTRGKDVRLASGTPIAVKLTSPVTIKVPVKKK